MEKGVKKTDQLWKSSNFKLMFIGEYKHNIDQKKRLSIPVKFRKLLGKKVVITQGLDKCLFLYPYAEWQKLAQKLSQLPMSRSDVRGFVRMMLAGAMETNIDNLGRILIPDYLKNYADLKKSVIVTGLYNRLEIWDESLWLAYKKKTEKEIGDMAERLKELGI